MTYLTNDTEKPSLGGSALNDGLGLKLARDLMALGDLQTKAQRIEFKGGTWPNAEISQGGMCEEALARFFASRLAEYLPPN